MAEYDPNATLFWLPVVVQSVAANVIFAVPDTVTLVTLGFALNVGFPPVFPTNTVPVGPAAVAFTAPVPFPSKIPYWVSVVSPVPP